MSIKNNGKQSKNQSKKQSKKQKAILDSGLRLTPLANAKLEWFLAQSSNEMSAMGITREGDLSLVEDFKLFSQKVTGASVESEGIVDFLDKMVKQGIEAQRCMRVWMHTHPGFEPNPSATDLEECSELFQWQPYGFMMIASSKGIKNWLYIKEFNMCFETDVLIDNKEGMAEWEKEYKDNVTIDIPTTTKSYGGVPGYVGKGYNGGYSGGFGFNNNNLNNNNLNNNLNNNNLRGSGLNQGIGSSIFDEEDYSDYYDLLGENQALFIERNEQGKIVFPFQMLKEYEFFNQKGDLVGVGNIMNDSRGIVVETADEIVELEIKHDMFPYGMDNLVDNVLDDVFVYEYQAYSEEKLQEEEAAREKTKGNKDNNGNN